MDFFVRAFRVAPFKSRAHPHASLAYEYGNAPYPRVCVTPNSMDTAVTDQDLFLCIGCGEDLTSRVKDIRNLLSPNASDDQKPMVDKHSTNFFRIQSAVY